VIGERWLIHGMNHFWPGGSSDPDLANFTDPMGPSGAEASWAFLSQYTKSSTEPPCTEAPDPDRSCANARNGTLPGVILAVEGEKAIGTDVDDVILGTDSPDRILGRGGSDLICGRRGNDRIHGGQGRDRCRGGRGRDALASCE